MKIFETYGSTSIIELSLNDLNDLLKLKGSNLNFKNVVKIEIHPIDKTIKIEGE